MTSQLRLGPSRAQRSQRQVGMFLGDLRQLRHHRRHGGVLREVPEVLSGVAARGTTEQKPVKTLGKMGKSWENHRKTIEKWENDGKMMGKPWEKC